MAIGNPFGYLDQTMTTGVVSGLNRWLDTQFGTVVKGVVQTDAAINPGNSGGPLLDSSGRLIGMNTAIPNVTGASVGIGFAIPVDTLNRIVPLLIARGNMQRPPLGFVSLRRRDADQVYGIQRGIVIELVEPGSVADRAGLKGLKVQGDGKPPLLGDVILGFQGQPLAADVLLSDQLDLLPPKTPLVFDVLREGKEIQVTLRPWEAAAPTEKISI
jgi:S1-C subfamily serine protease